MPSAETGGTTPVKAWGSIKVLSELENKKASKLFFHELFTEAERVMFAKRLTIILMLLDKHSLYRIYKTLHVSTATAARIKTSLSVGYYNHIVMLLGKKRRAEFYVDFEVLLRAGMPSMGRDRWKGFKSPIKRIPPHY